MGRSVGSPIYTLPTSRDRHRRFSLPKKTAILAGPAYVTFVSMKRCHIQYPEVNDYLVNC